MLGQLDLGRQRTGSRIEVYDRAFGRRRGFRARGDGGDWGRRAYHAGKGIVDKDELLDVDDNVADDPRARHCILDGGQSIMERPRALVPPSHVYRRGWLSCLALERLHRRSRARDRYPGHPTPPPS